MSDKTLGRLAFEAYCQGVGGLTFDGKPIPGWDELHGDRLKVQGGWEAAAEAVVEELARRGAAARGQRADAGRWVPLGTAQAAQGGRGVPVQPMAQQADAERAEAASRRVPVQVDDEPPWDGPLFE